MENGVHCQLNYELSVITNCQKSFTEQFSHSEVFMSDFQIFVLHKLYSKFCIKRWRQIIWKIWLLSSFVNTKILSWIEFEFSTGNIYSIFPWLWGGQHNIQACCHYMLLFSINPVSLSTAESLLLPPPTPLGYRSAIFDLLLCLTKVTPSFPWMPHSL